MEHFLLVTLVFAFVLMGLFAVRLLRSPRVQAGAKYLPVILKDVGVWCAGPHDEDCGARVELIISGTDEQTHDLIVRVVLLVDAAALLGIYSKPFGAGALGPVVKVRKHDMYPDRLELENPSDDPELQLTFIVAHSQPETREVHARWKLSEVVAEANLAGSWQRARVTSELRLPTLHEPRLFPDDRYSTEIFRPHLGLPAGFRFQSGAFLVQPALFLRAGSALQHWECRTLLPEGGGALRLGLRRGAVERWTLESLSTLPLLLALTVTLTFSVSEASTDLFLKAVSVFMSILALRTIVPASVQSSGVTKADLKLYLAAAVMLIVVVFESITTLTPLLTGGAPSEPEASHSPAGEGPVPDAPPTVVDTTRHRLSTIPDGGGRDSGQVRPDSIRFRP